MPLPRFTRNQAAASGSAAVDPAAGAPGAELEQIFAGFAQQQGARAVRQAQEEATLEGFNEGLTADELPEESNLTAASRAFNVAARAGHIAAVRGDIKTRLTELSIQAKGLAPEDWVDAYIKTSEGYRDGLIEELDPAMRGPALAYFNDTASAQRLTLLNGQQSELRKRTVEELKIGQAQLLDDINTAAREGNDELVAVRQREFEAMMTAAGESGLVNPAIADASIKNMHSVAVQSELLGAFDFVMENEGLEAGRASLDRFKRADATDLGMSAEEKDQMETTMTGLYNRERAFQAQAAARQTAEEKAARAALMREAGDTISQLNAGYSSPDVEDLARTLAESEELSKLAELTDAVEMQGKISLFQSAPLVAQDQALDQMREELRAGNADSSEFKTFEALEQARNQTAALLNKDPRELAVRQGVIESAANMPLSFESIDALAASLAARRPSTEAASGHYGRTIPVLDAAETEQFGAFWTGQGVPEKLALSQAVMAGLGPQGEGLLQSLDKKGYKMAAFTGSLMAENLPNTAAAVLRGQEAIAASDEIMPQGIEGATLDDDLTTLLGRSMAHLPEFRQTTVNAIKAWYADRAASEGDFSGVFDAGRLELATEAVVGNILTDRMGHEFPLRDVEQSQFDAWFDGLEATDIEAAGGMAGHTTEEALQTLSGTRILAVGPGVFRFATPTLSDTPAILVRPDGKPFELTIDITDLPPPERFPDNSLQAL